MNMNARLRLLPYLECAIVFGGLKASITAVRHATGVTAWSAAVITDYINEALHRARYSVVDEDTFCGTVPGLPGVIATGATLEACRDQLGEVVEEWVLVRVSRGLSIPRLGSARVRVRRAS